MWNDVNFQGVGQRWDQKEDASRLVYLHRGIDFIEPSLPCDLSPIPAGTTLLAHSSELGLATSGPLNAQMVDVIAAQVRPMNSPWAGEHFCLTSSFDTGELGYNFSPPLDDASVDAAVAHVLELQSAYGCRLALEAGPRYLAWNDHWDDLAVMTEIAEQTDAGVIVDVSHHICSMVNLRRKSTDGLSARVLARTIELHITGWGIHSTDGYRFDSHRSVVPNEAWELLDWILPRAPHLKAVTLEHAHDIPDQAYAADLVRLNLAVKERR